MIRAAVSGAKAEVLYAQDNLHPGSSIGADIVYPGLTSPDRSLLPSFYSKILAAPEHGLRPSVLSFHTYLWLCWSVKESAYKFERRRNPALRFSPTKIVIGQCGPGLPGIAGHQHTDKTCFLSTVRIGREVRYATTWVGEFIFTVIADPDDMSRVLCATEVLPSRDPEPGLQSLAVRDLALEHIHGQFPERDWQIISREDGCPTLFNGTRNVPISLAHHGAVVGFAALQP